MISSWELIDHKASYMLEKTPVDKRKDLVEVLSLAHFEIRNNWGYKKEQFEKFTIVETTILLVSDPSICFNTLDITF